MKPFKNALFFELSGEDSHLLLFIETCWFGTSIFLGIFLGIPRERDYTGGWEARRRGEVKRYIVVTTHARLALQLVAYCSGSSKRLYL